MHCGQEGHETRFNDQVERDELFRAQAQAFLECLQGKSPPAVTLADGIAVTRVIVAAKRSAAGGSAPVNVMGKAGMTGKAGKA